MGALPCTTPPTLPTYLPTYLVLPLPPLVVKCWWLFLTTLVSRAGVADGRGIRKWKVERGPVRRPLKITGSAVTIHPIALVMDRRSSVTAGLVHSIALLAVFTLYCLDFGS